jgi:hypothetical protein
MENGEQNSEIYKQIFLNKKFLNDISWVKVGKFMETLSEL